MELYLGTGLFVVAALLAVAFAVCARVRRARADLLYTVVRCAEDTGVRHWVDRGTLEDWVAHSVASRSPHHLSVCIDGEIQHGELMRRLWEQSQSASRPRAADCVGPSVGGWGRHHRPRALLWLAGWTRAHPLLHAGGSESV